MEVYLGKFGEGFREVSSWARVTNNERADYYPDVWIEGGEASRVSGQFAGPGQPTPSTGAPRQEIEQLVVRARCVEVSAIPDPKTILPYRRALIVHRYRVREVLRGRFDGSELLVAHWAIRDAKIIPSQMRIGSEREMTLESMQDHAELQGERQIITVEEIDLPLFYDVTSDSR